ncbi:MAG: type I-E CRISPR-associated protein Cas6/Cse3/CasE [Microthrixaceae bacterium]
MKVFLSTVPLARAGRSRSHHQVAHRTVMGLFPPLGDHARSEAAVLFRIEPAFSRILVQSTTPPSDHQLASLKGEVRTADLGLITAARVIQYRIDVAAVERTGRTERRLSSAAIPAWWAVLAERSGLEIQEPFEAHLMGTTERRAKAGPQPQLRLASLAGTARITDSERALHVLVHGIGRAKAYGCGLLSAVPAS